MEWTFRSDELPEEQLAGPGICFEMVLALKKEKRGGHTGHLLRKGIAMGDRPDLTGGGLIRSMGGWSVVKAMRRAGEREKGDERILGSGAFVSEIINQAEEKIKHQVGTLTDVDNLMKKEIARCCKKGKGDGFVASIRQSQVAPAKIKKNPCAKTCQWIRCIVGC